MRQKPGTRRSASEKIVKDIQRATRKQYSAEEKIRIVLDGLRGEDSIAELCRREGISQGVYYKWSKDFMEAGKRRLAGDTERAATTDEVKDLRREVSIGTGLLLSFLLADEPRAWVQGVTLALIAATAAVGALGAKGNTIRNTRLLPAVIALALLIVV